MKSIPQNSRILFITLWALLPVCLISACQPYAPTCPPGSVTYLSLEDFTQDNPEQEVINPAQQLVEINGQYVWVNQLLEGILCDGSWSGTVYVPCQVQIYTWEEEPLFFENCDLSITPGTVIDVATHNDKPYYQGCSCHTGDMTQ